MESNCYNVMAVAVDTRNQSASDVQDVLTKHGCAIRARLGLPQQEVDACTNQGLLILQICAEKEELEEIKAELNGISGVKASYISI